MLDQTDLTGVCAGIQEKKVSQLPCLHAELRAQDARDRGGGQACQIGAGGGWPGRAEVLDTHQTADHSMSGNWDQTPVSRVSFSEKMFEFS